MSAIQGSWFHRLTQCFRSSSPPAHSYQRLPTYDDSMVRVASPSMPRTPVIDPRPIIQFNTLYLQFYYHSTVENGQALLGFLQNDANKRALVDNAKYQVPPYAGADLSHIYTGAIFCLSSWLNSPDPSPREWQWTVMWEWVNTVHFLCPDPVDMVSEWRDYLQDPISTLDKYPALFCQNPYNTLILSDYAQNMPKPPYVGGQFAIDWSTTRVFSNNWMQANARSGRCYTEGPAMDGLQGAFQNLTLWCPPRGSGQKMLNIRTRGLWE